MIDCHIIFTEETDRSDWLHRCVASLEHPDVTIHVHRFVKADEHYRLRRTRITNANDPDRWCMFADPDDYAVEPGYSRFIEHLKTFEGECTYPNRLLKPGEIISRTPDHLVATRGYTLDESEWREVKMKLRLFSYILFPEVAYVFNHNHGGNTRGGTPC